MLLKGKKILIGITASIAAYKIPLLVRLLKKEGASVRILMTPAAHDFVTPLTFSTLSEEAVLTQPFDKVDGSWNSHIDLGYWADLFLIAPASANTLSAMACGRADNLLLATVLAARCPVFFAPAMDVDMFQHPATQNNIKILIDRGNQMIEPASGALASGLCGAGRLEEPERIFELIRGFFFNELKLKGQKILITAGPTYESIDPVRFIGNYSSGKMGFALAETAAQMGAKVCLVAGPVHLSVQHPSIERIDVTTAQEMYEQCLKAFPDCNAAILSAAVADFTPEAPALQKIKKGALLENGMKIGLKPTKDILKSLGGLKTKEQLLVGFALETENEQTNAKEKLATKNCNMIVLNSLNEKGAGFHVDTNKVQLIYRDGRAEDLPLKSKKEVAIDILNALADLMNA